MKKEYRVRPYQPGDEGEIVQLLDLAFEGWPRIDLNCSSLDYWKWMYSGNPLGLVSIPVCLNEQDEIVGCIHTTPKMIKIGSEVFLCCLGGDHAVHTSYRRLGITKKMVTRITELRTNAGMKIAYFSTRVPFLIKDFSRNFPRFPHPITNLVRILDIDKQIRAMPIENTFLRKHGFHALKFLNNMKNFFRGLELSNPDLEVSEIDSFDERIDAFWKEVKDHYHFIIERNLEYLNWRYCDAGSGGFSVKQVEEDGRIIGFSVLRINRYRSDYPVGYIVDLLALPDRVDAADELAKDAIKYFDSRNINIINFQVVKGHPYERILKRHGFLDSRIKIYMFYQPLGNFDGMSNLKSSPEKIFISWGDHDTLPVNIPRYR